MLAIVLQARMGSSRLPGKVLYPLHGRPVLSWIVRSLRLSDVQGKIVIATGMSPSDDPIAQLAAEEQVEHYRGNDEDVLSRFVGVAETTGATVMMRICGDCPLLDPVVVHTVVSKFASGGFDYVGTINPRTLPLGFDAEVFTTSALRKADLEATGVDRIHVTSYIYRNPHLFTVGHQGFEPPSPSFRLTLDTVEDARAIEAVVAELGDNARDWKQVVALLRSRPDIVAMNAGIKQRDISRG